MSSREIHVSVILKECVSVILKECVRVILKEYALV